MSVGSGCSLKNSQDFYWNCAGWSIGWGEGERAMCEPVKESKVAESIRTAALEAFEGKSVVYLCSTRDVVRERCANMMQFLDLCCKQYDTATIVEEDGVSANVRVRGAGSVTFKWGGASKGNQKFRILEDIDLPENTVRGYPSPDLRWDKRGTIPGEPPALTVWYRVTGAKAKMFLPAGIPLDVKPIEERPADYMPYWVEAPVSMGQYKGRGDFLTADQLDEHFSVIPLGGKCEWAILGFETLSGKHCGIYEAGVALRAMVKNGVRNVVVEVDMEAYSRHKQVRAIEFVRNVYKLAGGVCD